MTKESAMSILQNDILLQEAKRNNDFLILKEQLNTTYESLRPINFIKNTIKDVTASPDIKEGIGKTLIGIATGFLAKKIMLGSSQNPLKKIAGMALQAIVTKIATNNSDKIKDSGINIFYTIKSLINPTKKETENHVLNED